MAAGIPRNRIGPGAYLLDENQASDRHMLGSRRGSRGRMALLQQSISEVAGGDLWDWE